MKLIRIMYATYLTAAIICVIFASMSYPSSASEGSTNLVKLVKDNEDVRINAQDLAFLLATHGFDAVPKGGYVIVKLDKATYKMTPNGVKPGLADMS
jgi:hypothetical protein